MTREELILDRYEPLGTAGEGGFGTVQIAWDPRIQRKVAIKTIRLTALDAVRAALPGAQAVAGASTADRWHGVQPWGEYLGQTTLDEELPRDPMIPAFNGDQQLVSADYIEEAPDDSSNTQDEPVEQVTALSHLPGLDEARTAAMLSDPRIVTVYDFEVRGRTAYLIMEYVEGITLTDLLADYADYLTLDMVAAVFDSVAGALTVAHETGVLHLDIKPDNIMINTQGQVKVTDFGLATLADASGEGKTGGGTIGYMPPEQIRREHLDARADEWSLASILYEMLTGSNPFRVKGLDAAEAAISEAELVLPSLCWKDVDEQIDDVVFYALDPDRDERYASVADFAEEADKFLGDADRGFMQLKLVVEDALGIEDEAEPEPAADRADVAYEDEQAPAPERRSFTERFLGLIAPGKDDEETGADDLAYDEDLADEEPRSSKREKPTPPRDPILSRIPNSVLFIASHAFGAVASGLLAFLALANMQPLTVAFGPGSAYVIAVLAVAVGVAGAIRSHIGALIGYCLLGIAIVMCGHPIVGAIVLIATVAWWYTVGHEGAASANVALLAPVAGAIGASSMVPFFSGASLTPVRAVATTVFAIVIAVILGGFGSMSILDWQALAHWDFGRAEVSHTIWRMLGQPATWATIGGWIVATLAFSLLRLRESKVLYIAGVAVALIAVLVGTLAFSGPSPQLIVSSIVACAVLVGIVA